jgi:hypothetical protein
VIILEQDHRLVRRFARQGDRVGCRRLRLRRRGIGIGVLEQPRLELEPEDAPHRLVYQRHRHATVAHQLGQVDERFGVGGFDVDAGLDRPLRSVGDIVVQVVASDQLADAVIVAHHRALISPLTAQDVVQKP